MQCLAAGVIHVESEFALQEKSFLLSIIPLLSRRQFFDASEDNAKGKPCASAILSMKRVIEDFRTQLWWTVCCNTNKIKNHLYFWTHLTEEFSHANNKVEINLSTNIAKLKVRRLNLDGNSQLVAFAPIEFDSWKKFTMTFVSGSFDLSSFRFE